MLFLTESAHVIVSCLRKSRKEMSHILFCSFHAGFALFRPRKSAQKGKNTGQEETK